MVKPASLVDMHVPHHTNPNSLVAELRELQVKGGGRDVVRARRTAPEQSVPLKVWRQSALPTYQHEDWVLKAM